MYDMFISNKHFLLILISEKYSGESIMSKKCFEYKDDKSDKFWEIDVNGNAFKVVYGRTGTEGRELVKEFGNEEAALKEAESLIKSKLKKGYKETGRRTDSKITDLLKKIVKFYSEKSPVELEKHKLIKADEIGIKDYEKLIGEKLPDDYKIFLLENNFEFNFDGNFKVLSLKESMEEWKDTSGLLDDGIFDDGRIQQHEDEGFGNWDSCIIKKVWWSKKWIPVSEDSCGNMYCIDLDPGKNGKKYQMMNMEFQDGQGPFATKYTSFTDYLEKHLEYLKNGQYNFEDYGSYKCIAVDSYKKPQDVEVKAKRFEKEKMGQIPI
jgi:predicted DNA-binding WGR domain protein